MEKLEEKARESRFNELYRLFYPAVAGSIYSRINNREDTDEITQDVFLELSSNLDEIENVRAWLYKTLRRKVIDYYRKGKKIPENIAIEGLNMTFVNGFRDTRIIIQDAIDNIADDMGSVIFNLIAVQYYSNPEVTKVTGLSIDQVRYKYGQVIRNVQDYLKTKGISSMEDLL
ncbi:MAG: RNA polymerase sigma factor [bacterium]|nr:RNA polymerase sigma factor [bacterium]